MLAAAAAAAGAWGQRTGAQPSASPPPVAATTAFQPFDFVALGDMPYGPDSIKGPPYRHLIDQINALGLPFAIHIGDFKDGLAACSDAEFALQHQHFMRFARALIYTPGDNDWLDCQRRGDDALERLQALRQRFFARPQSLGQHPMALQRQGDLNPAFARYIENQRWAHQGVVFATFHTVGPDNGVSAPQAGVRAEVAPREAANAAWITEAFALARQTGARALVLATQAEALRYPHPAKPHEGVLQPAFALSFQQTLLPLAQAAPFPVLLIHGDAHHFMQDRPFRDAQGQRIANLWRLQVFGEPRMHAVRVRINPAALAGQPVDQAPPFSFSPIWNPMSPDPRMPQSIER